MEGLPTSDGFIVLFRMYLGLWWKEVETDGKNPITGETVTVTRRKLFEEYELPYGDEYRALIEGLVSKE